MDEKTTNQAPTPEGGGVTSEVENKNAPSQRHRQSLAKVTQIIWLLTGILEGLIGVRFLLKLLGANPEAGFSQFIYGITQVFLVPFLPLFAAPAAEGSVLEISSLVAMLVYALFAWGMVRVLWVIFAESPTHGGGPGAPA